MKYANCKISNHTKNNLILLVIKNCDTLREIDYILCRSILNLSVRYGKSLSGAMVFYALIKSVLPISIQPVLGLWRKP